MTDKTATILIEIEPQKNNFHNNNHVFDFQPSLLPKGWAIFPSTIEHEGFPFGEIETEIIDGIPTVTKWEPVENIVDDFLQTEDLGYLHYQLNTSDYKIIKYQEYILAGLEPPYDIQKLHKERQALRDKINELEQEEANNSST